MNLKVQLVTVQANTLMGAMRAVTSVPWHGSNNHEMKHTCGANSIGCMHGQLALGLESRVFFVSPQHWLDLQVQVQGGGWTCKSKSGPRAGLAKVART